MQGAIDAGINVGAYFYTQAITVQEAVEEAKYCIKQLQDYNLTMPVYFDVEATEGNGKNGRLNTSGLSIKQRTAIAEAFCETIEEAGYDAGIYSCKSYFLTYLDPDYLATKYEIWLANYASQTSYSGDYHMWQYTSSGSVPGISGRVDMNVSYFSVTNDITKRQDVSGINSDVNQIAISFRDVNVAAEMKESTYLRTTPSLSVPNKAGSVEAGTSIVITGVSDTFIRIKYNDNTYYVDSIGKIKLPNVEWVKNNINEEIVLKKDEKLYIKPYYYLYNNVFDTLKIGTRLKLLGYNNEYLKVEYNGNVYYIYDNNTCYEAYVEPNNNDGNENENITNSENEDNNDILQNSDNNENLENNQ